MKLMYAIILCGTMAFAALAEDLAVDQIMKQREIILLQAQQVLERTKATADATAKSKLQILRKNRWDSHDEIGVQNVDKALREIQGADYQEQPTILNPSNTGLEADYIRDRRLCDKDIVFTPGNSAKALDPKSELGQTMIAANGSVKFKAVTHGKLMLADELLGKPNVLCTEPPGPNIPAILDFSKLTKKGTGLLALAFRGHPGGDGVRVVIKLQGQTFKTVEIPASDWTYVEVPFNKESVIIEHYPTGWYYEHLFITYSLRKGP